MCACACACVHICTCRVYVSKSLSICSFLCRYSKQNMLLCGLWYDKDKPMMTTFLYPLMSALIIYARLVWPLYAGGWWQPFGLVQCIWMYIHICMFTLIHVHFRVLIPIKEHLYLMLHATPYFSIIISGIDINSPHGPTKAHGALLLLCVDLPAQAKLLKVQWQIRLCYMWRWGSA